MHLYVQIPAHPGTFACHLPDDILGFKAIQEIADKASLQSEQVNADLQMFSTFSLWEVSRPGRRKFGKCKFGQISLMQSSE